MSKSRRTVTSHPADPPRPGRPMLWAHGVGCLSSMAEVSHSRARTAILRGEVDPGDLFSCVCWALERRGFAKFAFALRRLAKGWT